MATAGALSTRMILVVSAALAAGLVGGLIAEVPYRPAAAQVTGRPTPGDEPGEGGAYVHPGKKFSLSMPPGARWVDPGGRVDVTIRSPKGYAVNVQTGAVNFSLDLPGMAAKLEAVYLGPNKTWQRKTGERTLKIAGLPAYDALYEGVGVRARVVVVRGATTDFVFMFFARPGIFDSVTPEFDALLRGFRPAAEELAAALSAPGAAETRRRFESPAYAIGYPADWKQSSPRPDIILFRADAGSGQADVSVAIQDVAVDPGGNPGQAVARVVAELKSQLAAGASDVVYLDNGDFAGDGASAGSGWQFQVVYTLQGERVQQRSIIVPAARQGVIHIWTYAAPSLDFERFRPVAESMLATWTLRRL